MTRLLALALVLVPALAQAGGGPPNVLVLHRAEDPEASATADHYAEARQLPPGHVCPLSGAALAEPSLAFADYLDLVRAPLEACLDLLPQPDEIDYLVLVRGLPYRVVLEDGSTTSLSAMLQVGRAAHTTSGFELAGYSADDMLQRVVNPLYPLEGPEPGDYLLSNPSQGAYSTAPALTRTAEHRPSFRRADAGELNRWDFSGELFVVTRLDGFDHEDARALVDRAVLADGSFPEAELLCMRGADAARGARDPECEFTVRKLAEAGFAGAWLPEFDPALAGREVVAYLTGAADLRGAIDGQTYVPGAFVDNLTSFGAVPNNFVCDGETCPGTESQTSIARFVRAGATAVHGTVAEPFNVVFPNAGLLLHYTAGYNLGESVLFNQRFLYWKNTLLGDPLVSPWAERPELFVEPAEPGAHPRDVPLSVRATHPRGVARLVAYADGERVAEVEGDALELDLSAFEVGDEPELLLVATAADAPSPRPGWDVEAPLFRPEVQGWVSVSVRVGEPRGAPEAEDPEDPASGCACASQPRADGSAALAGLLGIAALRQRRRVARV